MPWFVYLIECHDGSLYTGISTDVEARFRAHQAGKGARYTRAHPPRQLLKSFCLEDRATALRAEYRIKQLRPDAKRRLCEDTLRQLLES